MTYIEKTELQAGIEAHSQLRVAIARLPERTELPQAISEVKRLIGVLRSVVWTMEPGWPAGR
jgi:hypothetical protein